MSLRISRRYVGDVTILDLNGMITLGEESSVLRQTIRELLNENRKQILVNMASAKYIDSAGNGELASSWTAVRNQGGTLKLLSPTAKIREVLQITKLYAIYEVFGDEAAALKSFQVPILRCQCPGCGYRAIPPLVGAKVWPPLACGRCNLRFAVSFSQSSEHDVLIKSVCIQTYAEEYLQVLAGPPLALQIIGRLDLFSSSALERAWAMLPTPRRVMFELSQATEIDDAGREALYALLEAQRGEARVVVSLEGLDQEKLSHFPSGPPFHKSKELALLALGDISDAPAWQGKVVHG